MIISLAACYHFHLHQMGETTAFLNGKLEEEVFMSQPEGKHQEGPGVKTCAG